MLRTSKLETSTEFSIRSAAAERLGFDLSKFPYRQLVDSFLLSTAILVFDTTPSHRDDDGTNTNNDVNCENRQKKRKLSGGGDGLQDNYDGKLICKDKVQGKVTFQGQSKNGLYPVPILLNKDVPEVKSPYFAFLDAQIK